MLCEDKDRLLKVYVQATDRHAASVTALSKTTEERVAFMKALTRAEQDRKAAESARLALRDHADTHGC
jgi:hypothetical protein